MLSLLFFIRFSDCKGGGVGCRCTVGIKNGGTFGQGCTGCFYIVNYQICFADRIDIFVYIKCTEHICTPLPCGLIALRRIFIRLIKSGPFRLYFDVNNKCNSLSYPPNGDFVLTYNPLNMFLKCILFYPPLTLYSYKFLHHSLSNIYLGF